MICEPTIETAPADFSRLITDWAEIAEIKNYGAYYDLTGFELAPVVYDPR